SRAAPRMPRPGTAAAPARRLWAPANAPCDRATTVPFTKPPRLNDIVGTNTRTFELAASRACQLASYREDLTSLFKPGEEILVYRDLGELRRHLDHYIARPDDARAIGENGRRRALAEHTLRHRLEEMLDTVA